MTRDDILEMAYEAGFGNIVSMPHIDGFVRFANLVAQSERESCAKVCEVFAAGMENGLHQGMSDIEARLTNEFAKIGCDLAETIRMRDNK